MSFNKLITVLLAASFLLLQGCLLQDLRGKNMLNTTNPSVVVNKLWSTKIGVGTWKSYARLSHARYGSTIYAVDLHGKLKAIDIKTGTIKWRTNLKIHVVSDTGISKDFIMLGSSEGILLVLDRLTGAIKWQAAVTNEIIAAPIYHQGKIFVKTTDSIISAFDAKTGNLLWSHKEPQVEIAMRVGSSLLVKDSKLLAGMPNGKLIALSLADGKLLWQKAIASNLDQGIGNPIIDLDVTPIGYGNNIYIAGMNSNLVALDISSYETKWQKPISTYSGIDVDRSAVVVSDADGIIYSYKRNTGRLIWRQKGLQGRTLTKPSIYKDYILVADTLGYLYVLSHGSGKIIGGTKVHYDGISANIIVSQGKVIVKSNHGYLNAYELKDV